MKQLSSRCYSSDPIFVRRSENGPYMPLSQGYSIDGYETSSASSRRATPASDCDKSGAVVRKRVPVAVSYIFCEGVLADKSNSANDVVGERSNVVVTRVAVAPIVAMPTKAVASSSG
jgi:hypothetical protein